MSARARSCPSRPATRPSTRCTPNTSKSRLDALQGILDAYRPHHGRRHDEHAHARIARGTRLPGSARRERPTSAGVSANGKSTTCPSGSDGRESLEALAGYMEHARLQKLKASTQIMIMPGLSASGVVEQPDNQLSPTAEHAAAAGIGIHRRTVETQSTTMRSPTVSVS